MIIFAVTTLEGRGPLEETTTWRDSASTHAGVSTGESCETAIVRKSLRRDCLATLTCGAVSSTQLGRCAERDLTLVYSSDAPTAVGAPARAILSQRAARGMWKTEDGVILLEKRDAP